MMVDIAPRIYDAIIGNPVAPPGQDYEYLFFIFVVSSLYFTSNLGACEIVNGSFIRFLYLRILRPPSLNLANISGYHGQY